MTGVMVVTGASRGIGAATARLGGKAGYKVCVNYLGSADRAEALVEEIRKDGGTAIAVRADTGNDADVVRLFETVDTELGPLTALVNNAGVLGGEHRVDEADAEHLAELWRVNITGYFLCAREAVRRMSTRHGGKGGAIVNVNSVAAKLGGRDRRAHYAASKGAGNTFTVALAKEVAEEGIRVTGVMPGLIDTDFHAPYGRERIERLGAAVPIGRYAQPEEVAEAVLWLLSDKASYVTGTMLEVSGGR